MVFKKSLPLLIATSLTASLSAHAQDSDLMPSLYGKVNVTAVLNDYDLGDSSGNLESNASRIGLEGDIPLNDSLKVVYQAEYQINPGDEVYHHFSLSQRNTYIGLEGGFGTVVVGRNDTPAKLMQSGIDLFNDLNGDIRTLFVSEVRPNDEIHYTSPTVSGFTLMHASIIDGQDSLRERATKSTSTALTYGQGNYLFGIAMDNNLTGHDSFRVMSRYRSGGLQLGLMYETAKTSKGDNDGIFVSASYKIDKLVLKAQTGAADQKKAGGVQSTVGADYNLDEDSKVFAFITSTSADNSTVDNKQYGFGFEYNF
ncbi:MAG: porin [Pseudomonadales bacterium]|nr:porin [Pseudomonadales bacterium]MCP5358794.1 porin [Pseudomonadales bacterium]